MKTSTLIHPDMGEQVLKRLGKLVDIERLLTTGGVVAGQSVASAVAEIIQSPHATAFNDVDVFREIKESEFITKSRRFLDPLVQTDAHLSNAYGQLRACEDFHYKVQRTMRDGLLNEVLCQGQAFASTADRAAFKVLASFDLNCVQVGVNLETQKLVWTPAYEQFLHTQELLVENVRTPVHTAIRWFRKKAELEGIFGNDERTMQMLAIVSQLLRPEENTSAQAQGQLNFSTPYLNKLEDVRKEVSTWFNVEDSVSSWVLPEKSISRHVFGEIPGRIPRLQKQGDIPLYTLRPRFDPPTDWVPSHLTYSHRFAVPLIRAKQGFWKKHICEQILDAAAKEDSIQHMHLLAYGGKAFETPHSPRALASLNKSLRDHYLQDFFHAIPLSKSLVVNEALKALAVERGPLVYGVVENMPQGELARALPEDPIAAKRILSEQVDRRLAELREMKSIAPVVPEMELPGGYKLVELTTIEQLLEEGSVMRHCVAGYYGAVSRGGARILSLRPALRKNALTMECTPDGLLFFIRQLHGVLNRNAEKHENDVGSLALDVLTICSLLRWLPANLRKRVAYQAITHPEWVQQVEKLNAFTKSVHMKKALLSQTISNTRLRLVQRIDNLVTRGLRKPLSDTELRANSLWKLSKYWSYLTTLRFQDKAKEVDVACPRSFGLVACALEDECADDIPF